MLPENKLSWIKAYREKQECGLKEAKEEWEKTFPRDAWKQKSVKERVRLKMEAYNDICAKCFDQAVHGNVACDHCLVLSIKQFLADLLGEV